MSSKIDYLFEDPEIPSQKYSLVTIVGPHMPQKCDVWGMKIRGAAATVEEAKAKVAKLMQIDNSYDIYIVDTGKFFPLAVEPSAIGNVEYQNETLNSIVKEYLQNRELADQEFNKRKTELTQAAIREGLNPDRKEEPVVTYTKIKTIESSLNDLTKQLDELKTKLNESNQEFLTKFSEEERNQGIQEFNEKIGQIPEPLVNSSSSS
jgi:chaperonin cofactor prefoldin